MFDSRKVPRAKGIGYPSCNTELALIPLNDKDPHGYYAEIGVSPGADEGIIRSVVRALLRELHPDTGSGDTERFQRILNIADVLLDPIARDKYNRTPKGHRLMDAVYEAELSKLDGLQEIAFEELERKLKVRNANPYAYANQRGARYDYFARDGHTDPWRADGMKSQLWYHFLIEAAPMVNYRRVVKVLMTNDEPRFHPAVGIMEIPRSWEPSSGLAHSLWTVVAGFLPGHNAPTPRE